MHFCILFTTRYYLIFYCTHKEIYFVFIMFKNMHRLFFIIFIKMYFFIIFSKRYYFLYIFTKKYRHYSFFIVLTKKYYLFIIFTKNFFIVITGGITSCLLRFVFIKKAFVINFFNTNPMLLFHHVFNLMKVIIKCLLLRSVGISKRVK